MADKPDDLALANGKVNAGKRIGRAEALGDAAKFKQCGVNRS